MIGDRGADMVAARHHGARAIGVLWGYGSREELRAAGAQAFCAAPRDLGRVLRVSSSSDDSTAAIEGVAPD